MMGGIPAEAFELQLEEPAGSEGKNKWFAGSFALAALTAV